MSNQSPFLPSSLTPGAPTATGTYFAVIRHHISGDDEMCVLHYREHKKLYRAVGHCFNRKVNAGEIVGYIPRTSQTKEKFINDNLAAPGWIHASHIPLKKHIIAKMPHPETGKEIVGTASTITGEMICFDWGEQSFYIRKGSEGMDRLEWLGEGD